MAAARPEDVSVKVWSMDETQMTSSGLDTEWSDTCQSRPT